ncbi:hypothetical protein EDB85DRAFT_2000265 [Lactarius pseudohatsudake]|nr:hypothetical protein EDB85DRAFT_2000265 [Lactarius pseudohatsudake]
MANPDVPSSSMPHPFHVIESLDLPPLDDDPHVPRSIHPAHRTAVDNPRIPATSLNPVTPQAIQAANFPSYSKATGAVHIWYTAERRASSDRPDFLSSPSPTPILDDMLQTGLLLSSNSPVTRPAHTSSLESHSPIPAPATPGTSRQWLSSAPGLGVAAEGHGCAEVSLLKEKDAIHPPGPTELPSQSPSPQSANDVAIAGPSRRSLDAEHTGDLPHPCHGQYDIV